MNEDWDCRFPVDDFGNEIAWYYVQRGFGCYGSSCWCDSIMEIVYDNEDNT